MKTFIELYKETYYIAALTEQQQAKWKLIQRYHDKVSPRLKQEAKNLFELGEKLHFNLIKEELMGYNFFGRLPKDENYESRLYHTPVVLGVEHGVVFPKEKK